jgi:hypothetical protein
MRFTPLCEISRKYGTDKGGVMHPYPNRRADDYHDYTPIYWDLLQSWTTEATEILEIGVASGRSARMWTEFFPNARYTGFDNRPECLITENHIQTFWCDQSDPASITAAVTASGVPLFDIIIDDGSHIYEHQVTAMSVLLPLVGDHGYYIIEDRVDNCPPVTDAVPRGYSIEVITWPHAPGDMLQIIRKLGVARFWDPAAARQQVMSITVEK